MSKYVIVGGGLTGGRACQGIRREDKEGSATLVAGEAHLPYQRPPLSKGYLTGRQGLDKVYVKDETYYADNHIDVIRGTRATAIDRAAHEITLANGRTLTYEKLLLATGATAWRLPIPGSDLPGVFTMRRIEDADAIRAASGTGQRAVVLGGSFIGSEVAASLTQLGLEVTMVFPEERLLQRVVPESLSAHLAQKYAVEGVQIRSGAKPKGLSGRSRVEQVELDNGDVLAADMVIMGVGIRLDTALARETGLEMGEHGAVIVDEFLRTSDPNVYAAGDIAAWPDPTFGRRLRVEHWDVAWRQGMRAGRNMAGRERPYTDLPYFFSDLFDLSFEVWGDLTTWDQTTARGSIASGSYAFYYFDGGRLTGVLAVNRPDPERGLMEALVKAQPSWDSIAAKLGDESVDLDTLTS